MNSKELEMLQGLLEKFDRKYLPCISAVNCSACSYRYECDVIIGALKVVTEKKIEEEKKCCTI